MLPSSLIEMAPFEEWREVPGMAPYQASSLGRIRRRRILAGRLDEDGYRRVSVSLRGKARGVFVHTMVTLAFHGPRPSPRHEVAHCDGKIANNRETNLRWATQLEQAEDKRRHGTMPLGQRHPNSKLTDDQRREICRLHIAGHPEFGSKPLARRLGVAPCAIKRVLRSGAWR